jgi:hypothetical protein
MYPQCSFEPPAHTFSAAKPWDILRVSNLSRADFDRYASNGIPILIEDAASLSKLPMEGMDCKKFANVFKSAHMRQVISMLIVCNL